MRRARGIGFLLLLTVFLSGSAPGLVDRDTPNLDLATLDGSPRDADGVADGVWTVDGSLAPYGRLRCGASAADACDVALSVSGDLELLPGSGIESLRGLRIDVGGDVKVHPTAFLVALEGDVRITAGGRVTIDGLVSATAPPSGVALGSISIHTAGDPGQPIRLGPDATIVSEGGDAGANAVDLRACGIDVSGLIAAVSPGPGTRVAIDSCGPIRVDGRDLGPLGEPEGPRRGRIEVSSAAGKAQISLAADESIALDGSALRAAGGPGARISVDARRGEISWRQGSAEVEPAPPTKSSDGRIRLAACAGVDLLGSHVEPLTELSVVADCDDGGDDRAAGEKAPAMSVFLPKTAGPVAGSSGSGMCTPDVLLSGMTVTTIEEYIACATITAEDFRIIPRGFVTFRAGQEIILANGFSVEGSSFFQAIIDPVLAQGTITITKKAVPAGGTGFGFTDDIAAPNAFTLDDGQTKTFTGVDPGTYTVTEDDPTPGFDLTDLDCTDPSGGTITSTGARTATIDLDPGETVSCTFTNTQRGTIIVEKQTDPDGAPGMFNFTGDAAGPIADNGTIMVSDLMPGTYTSTEDDPTVTPGGFDLTAISCDDGGSATPSTFSVATRTATFELDPGETVKCTFTNTQRGTIAVEKQTDPDGAPGMFNFTGDVAGPVGDNGTIVVSDLVPGTYTSTEDDPTVTPGGFDLTAISCDDGSSATPSTFSVATRTATFELDPGETVKCTFTNTQRGTIAVEKQTDPDGAPGMFNFTGDVAGLVSDNGTLVMSDLVPGTYTSTEDDPTVTPGGFDLTAISCDDGASATASTFSVATRTATFQLDPGETVKCTFTNTQRGSIVVEKQTDPDGAPGMFTFTGDAAGMIADDGTIVVPDLVPGTYTSTEDDPTVTPGGFDLSTIACDDGTSATPSTFSVPMRKATFEVDPGETVKCTFTNTQRGSIVIKKTTTPAGGTGFGFTDDIEAPNSFTLDDGQTKTFSDVVPGNYAVSESSLPPGWELVSATCDDGSAVNAIGLDPGETVTCTFDNAEGGTIIIKKATSPAGGTGFTFTQDMDASGNFMLDDGEMKTFTAVPAGTYAVSETLPPGWVLSSATCDDGSPVSAIDLSNAETVTCTFSNTNPPPVGGADAFDFVGNTLLLVDKSSSGGPEVLVSTTGGTTAAADGVLDNDADPQGEAVAVAGVFQSMTSCADATPPFTDCPTVNGGKVTMEANGQFSYTPKAGDTAASDMFGYRLSDGVNPPVDVTVTLTRKNSVWYVDNDHTPNGDPNDNGTSTDPFTMLSEAGTASADGDTIYVFNGDDTTSGQNAGITLKQGQRLLGEGVDLTVPDTLNGNPGPNTLFDSAANPRAKIEHTAGDAVRIDATAAARTGLEVRGLQIAGTGNAVDVTAAGANAVEVTIAENLIADSGSEAVDLNAGGSALFQATVENNSFSTSSPTGNAIDLIKSAAGDVEIAINDNTDITSSSGLGIRLDGSSGAGTLFVTGFSNNTVHGNTAGGGISVDTATFDADASTAPIEIVAGGATAVGSLANRVSGLGVLLDTVKGNLSFATLNVFNDGGTGLEVANSTLLATDFSLSSGTGTIDTANGTGLDLDPLTTALTLAGVTTGGTFAGPAVSLVDVAGTVDINGGSLAGSTGTIFAVGDGSAASGGTAAIAYDGTLADGGTTSVSIRNRPAGAADITLAGAIGTAGTPVPGTIIASSNAAGTILFSGAVNLATGGNAGVSLTGNTGATVNFTGGLDVVATSGAGFAAAGGGTVTVTGAGNTIATGSGTPLAITSTTVGAAGVTFATVNSTMAATGINLSDTGTGPVSITGSGSSIAAATSRGVDIQNHDGNFSYAGTISTAGAGRAVEVTNSGFAGGTAITFGGAVDDNGGGINLDNNDQGGDATITFSGGVTVNTSTATAFTAINGGVVNVLATGGDETLTATAGKGVDIDAVTTGITFDSISTTGSGSEGIELRNLAANSSFSVSGTTTVVNAAGDGIFIDSAGGSIDIDFIGMTTITNAGDEGVFVNDAPAGSDLDFGDVAINSRNTTGIFLDNVASGVTATFADVDIPGGSGGGYGVRAEDSAGAFSFASIDVSNTTRTAFETRGLNDVPTNDGDGDGIFLKNVSGGFTITGAGTQGDGGTIVNTAGDGIDARNVSGLSLTEVTIDDPDGRGIQGINLDGTHTVTDSTIRDVSASTTGQNTNGVFLATADASTLSGFTVSGTFAGSSSSCNFTNTSAGATPNPALQSFFLVVGVGSGDMTVTVDGCVFEQLAGQGFQADAGTSGGSGTVDVTVQNSRFRDASTISPFLNAIILATADADAELVFDVDNNLFDNVAQSTGSLGNVSIVRLQSASNGGDLRGTVSDNAIRNSGNSRRNAIGLVVEPDTTAGNGGFADVKIHNNVIDEILAEPGIFASLRERAGNSELEITSNRIGVCAAHPLYGAASPCAAGRIGSEDAGQGQGFDEGIFLERRGSAGGGAGTGPNLELRIEDNEVHANTTSEVLDIDGEDNSRIEATIVDNSFTNNEGGATNLDDGLNIEAKDALSAICLDLNAPNTAGEENSSNLGYEIERDNGAIFEIEGLGGASNGAAVKTFLEARNNNTVEALDDSGNFQNSGGCTLPTP